MTLHTKVLSLIDGRQTFKKKKKLIEWLMKKELLQGKMKCKLCKKRMKLEKHSNVDGLQWKCRRKKHRGKTTKKSVRSLSLFQRSKLSLFSWMKYIYRFSQGLQLRQIDMLQDGVAGSSRTLSKISLKLRKVCKSAIKRRERRGKQRLGGPNEFVMLDESNFYHKRKYGRGRFGPTWRRRKWVFGMLGIRGKRRRPILRLVKQRSRRHLIPLVTKYVRQGTTVITDMWRAYTTAIAESGFVHFSVNHSRSFVNPDTGAHTQNIERAWSTYKSQVWRLRGNRTVKTLKSHLALIEWTHWLANEHKDGPLGRLLHDIRHFRKF
ncbi:uncharacterized protein [Pseudochaenichthys georgianus]|uniref:uncharacterized protein isoform X1 n=2 Tax=Pseudochaenichthys georgianus TaxID=52239 RepID=UPI00146A1E53|nr:uncharacterized protein LOC117451640 [Pseudochaenichthys georgianus]